MVSILSSFAFLVAKNPLNKPLCSYIEREWPNLLTLWSCSWQMLCRMSCKTTVVLKHWIYCCTKIYANYEPSSDYFPSKIILRAHNFSSVGFSHIYCNIIISSNNCVMLWQNLALLLILWFEMPLFDSLSIPQIHHSQFLLGFIWRRGCLKDRSKFQVLLCLLGCNKRSVISKASWRAARVCHFIFWLWG